MEKKTPTPFDSGLLYTVIAVFYVYLAKLIGFLDLSLEANLVISQIMFLLVPPFLLAKMRGYDIKTTFRLKAPRPIEVFLMIFMSPVMIIAGYCAGFIAIIAVKLAFGNIYIPGEIEALTDGNIIISLLLVAVLPAFCEELLFRGMIQKGVEKLGVGWSIFLSGALFGLFHFDFQRLAAQTLMGFLVAYIVYRTGSVFNGMILHFMNNGLLTLLSKALASTQPQDAVTQVQIPDPFELPEYAELAQSYGMTMQELLVSTAAILAVVLAFTLLVLFGLILLVRAVTPKPEKEIQEVQVSKKGILMALPGLALIGIVYLATGLRLLGDPLGVKILEFFRMV